MARDTDRPHHRDLRPADFDACRKRFVVAARVVQRQSDVSQQQLRAQVCPYVSFSENVDDDAVRFSILNDGLGPAVLRNLSALVDGVPQSSYLAVLHALLGPHLTKRTPRGQRLGFTIDNAGVGSVIRPGDNHLGFSLRSKRFAPALRRAYPRVTFKICYCAIILRCECLTPRPVA